jgi:alkylhydroperoxidase family enzyme
MTFIRTLPACDADGDTLEMYRYQEAHWGYVPNYAKIFGERPEVLARWGRLLAEIRRPADDRRFELVTFVVARELKHTACALAHGGKLAGLIGAEHVIALAQGRIPEVLTPAEAAIVDYAAAIARDATTITSGLVAALREIHGLTDAEIFDIAAIAAARCFFAKLLDALGVEADVACMSMEPALRQALTLGRPISQQAPERVTAAA